MAIKWKSVIHALIIGFLARLFVFQLFSLFLYCIYFQHGRSPHGE